MKTIGLTLAVLVLACFLPGEVLAQTGFGPPGLGTGVAGQAFGQRPSNAAFSVPNQNVGALRSGSRFQRGSRRSNQFVGSDKGEQQSFVGAVQATTSGTGISSVSGLTTRSGPSAASVNQIRQSGRATGKYDPTMVVAFDLPAKTPLRTGREMTRRLSAQLSDRQRNQLSVQVNGRTAVVQGTVDSPSQRRIVARYLEMEPGLSTVDNRLKVLEESLPAPATSSGPTQKEKDHLPWKVRLSPSAD